MDLRPLTRPELERWHAAELAEAFPPHERKPLAHILTLLSEGRYEPLGLWEDAALLAYAFLMRHPGWSGYAVLDYLGVTAPRRGTGLGSHLLRQLASRSGGELLIAEAEAPDPAAPEAENAQRLRRLAFYARSGFQPLYDIAACGGRFRALALGRLPADREELLQAHRAIYGPARADVRIPY